MRLVAALAALVVLVACGNEPEPRAEESPAATPTSMPTEVPLPDGPVTSAYAATVIDDGGGAELCLGGVATSLPPQCSGPQLLGWDWSEHEGEFEDVRGVKWGDFAVTGMFDGRDLTSTDAVPADEFDAPEYDDGRDLTTPCPEPDGGWQVIDEATTTMRSQNTTMRAAQRLDGYAGAWVDQSVNPAYHSDDPREFEKKMNDPTLMVINVQVTGDPAAAEEALRETWGGALCVSHAMHTERELGKIHEAIRAVPGVLSSSHGFDHVDAGVIYDDGSLQAWADREYGDGVVRLTPALVPVD
ncbi:MAG: hypothetical protein M3237_21270 [Actinomycetota bacterium]|nr:hypothetical protein [Actinomycetota bacterium]